MIEYGRQNDHCRHFRLASDSFSKARAIAKGEDLFLGLVFKNVVRISIAHSYFLQRQHFLSIFLLGLLLSMASCTVYVTDHQNLIAVTVVLNENTRFVHNYLLKRRTKQYLYLPAASLHVVEEAYGSFSKCKHLQEVRTFCMK